MTTTKLEPADLARVKSAARAGSVHLAHVVAELLLKYEMPEGVIDVERGTISPIPQAWDQAEW